MSDKSKLNPLQKKELDIMDPEAKAKDMQKKSFADRAKDFKNNVEKAGKNIKRVGQVVSKLGPWGCLIVLLIIVIIGLIGFFANIPGLTSQKLKELAKAVSDYVRNIFEPSALVLVDDEKVVDVAKYLEDMDYNLVGYGFVRPVNVYDENNNSIKTYDDLIQDGYVFEYVDVNGEQIGQYRKNGTAYDGIFYNALGQPIDNSTGQIYEGTADDGQYIDRYGIIRSADGDQTTFEGQGEVVGFYNETQANLLKTYLLSDNRIYTLKNDDQSLAKKAFATLQKTFGGFDGGWAVGLIKVYTADKGIADGVWGFWDEFLWKNDIGIDSNARTLKIKKGYGNSSMSFKIEGWASRYGLPLELLLSLHIGTMAPDLVYAMVQNFDTEIQVYLQESGDSEIHSVYVDPDVDEDYRDPEYGIQLDEISQIVGNADFWGPLKRLTISSGDIGQHFTNIGLTKAQVQAILMDDRIVSPDTCLGLDVTAQTLEKTYYTDHEVDDPIEKYGIFGYQSNDSEFYDIVHFNKDKTIKGDNGTVQKNVKFTTKKCVAPYTTSNSGSNLSSHVDGWTFSNDEINTWLSDYSNHPDASEMVNETESVFFTHNDSDAKVYAVRKIARHLTWNDDYNGESLTFTFKNFKYIIYDTEGSTTGTYDPDKLIAVYEYMYIDREKTLDEKIETGYCDADGNVILDRKCSDADADHEPCDECKKYVLTLLKALAYVEDMNYETYTPYIARVVGSWFRDIYFVIPEEPDVAIKEYVIGKEGKAAIQGNAFDEKRAVYSPEHRDNSLYDMYYTRNGDSNTLNSNVQLNMVTVDSQYLAETDEYWTAYEMKKDENGNPTDEYQLYYLFPNGSIYQIDENTGERTTQTLEEFLQEPHEARLENEAVDSARVFESQAEAERYGYAFVKKPIVETEASIVSDSDSDDGILWIAYGFGESSTSEWKRVERADGNAQVNALYDIKEPGEDTDDSYGGGIYHQTFLEESVEQLEDAKRTETNNTIKNLFKYRKYYLYDGTEEKAMEIEEDKDRIFESIVDDLSRDEADGGYGVRWASGAAKDLAKNGRSALRRSYGSTTLSFTYNVSGVIDYLADAISDVTNIVTAYQDYLDTLESYSITDRKSLIQYSEKARSIAEQWYEWQLDMYYSQNENEFRTQGLLKITGDFRNPDLIGTVNINKSSLNAFTILENTETLDAEYQYRDFKELIVELNYFDKEDLSDKKESVFTWILPEVDSAGWPTRPFDKQNNEYGSLIESHDTYAALGVDFNPDFGEGVSSSGNETINENQQKVVDQCKTGDMLGSSGGWCLQWVTNVYDKVFNTSFPRYPCATEAAQAANSSSHMSKDDIPVGAAVFGHSNPNVPCGDHEAGHVGIYIGDGQVASNVGTVRIESLDSWIDGFGWKGWGYIPGTEEYLNGSKSVSALDIRVGAPTEDTDSDSDEQTDSDEDNNDEPLTTDRTLDASKILFVGDSWMEMLKNTHIPESTNFAAKGGENATWVLTNYASEITSKVQDDTSCIVVGFGLNGTNLYDKTQQLIDKLKEDYPNIPVYVVKTPHVCSNYNPDPDFNSKIDSYNDEMKTYCSSKDGVAFLDSTNNNICEDNGAGNLKDEYAQDPNDQSMGGGKIHLNRDGNQVWYDDIIAAINGTSTSGNDSNGGTGRALAVFNGYQNDNLVVSPVTGKIIEWGKHKRINVYTEEEEEVEYVVIEVMDRKYFTEGMVNNNSKDIEDLSDADTAKYLNYFYEEYEDVCAGFTVMIDGFDFDLSTQDSEGNNGSYEQNEVAQLYNRGEQTQRTVKEENKDKAPFFVNYGETAIELGNSDSVPESYKATENNAKGYYVKEGKYIGKTICTETEEESEDEEENDTDTNTTPNESTTPEDETEIENLPAIYPLPDPENSEEENEEDSEESEEEEEVENPAEYMRIMVKDLDYSVVEDVEEFFDIEEYVYGSGSGNADIGMLAKFICAFENGNLYNYLYGGSDAYDGVLYVDGYISRDRKYFYCQGDHLDDATNRNFGFGVCHRSRGAVMQQEYYEQVGVNIADAYFSDEYDSSGNHVQLEVEKVEKVREMIIQANTEEVKTVVGEDVWDQLTVQQQHCLIDISYQYGSHGTPLYTISNLVRSGGPSAANDADIFSMWGARGPARRKLWVEGIYTDASGNEIK